MNVYFLCEMKFAKSWTLKLYLYNYFLIKNAILRQKIPFELNWLLLPSNIVKKYRIHLQIDNKKPAFLVKKRGSKVSQSNGARFVEKSPCRVMQLPWFWFDVKNSNTRKHTPWSLVSNSFYKLVIDLIQ